MPHAQSTRAGRYRRQASGYSAFVPAPLPPDDPPLAMNERLRTLLSKADRELGRLDGSITTLPNPDLFTFMYVRKEAVLSSQIEGTQSSLQDLLSAEAEIYAPGRPDDVGEVINYVAALNYGLERLQKLPVSVRLIREIHMRLMAGRRGGHLAPGEVRRSQNWIGPEGCTPNEATFVPPPPDHVPEALGQLEKYLHAEDDDPLLIKIGLAHAQFETIHPFVDGNGRTGRLLITFLLCSREVLQKPVLYLSYYLKRRRANYYEKLQRVRDEGDWEGWLEFFLDGVIKTSAQATETARRILVLREDDRGRLISALGRAAGNGLRLLDHLYERPIITVTEVQKIIDAKSYQAANTLVARLVRLGILSEITGNSRNRAFRYDAYVRLFSDNQDNSKTAS